MSGEKISLPARRCAPGLVLMLAVASAGVACGGSSSTAGPAGSAPTVRAEGLEHEACDSGRVEQLDTNGDGKPDISRHVDGSGKETCRVVDLNHDGKPDMYEYFDGSGVVRRREYCYDDSGAVNAIEHYEGGKLARREYDVSGQRRIDTWDWFDPAAPVDAKTGRPAHPSRRERDTTGDGQVDQWWTWNGDQLTITRDKNGDGKPDPDTAITFGDGGAPTPAASAAPAASADGGASASGEGGATAAGGAAAQDQGGKGP